MAGSPHHSQGTFGVSGLHQAEGERAEDADLARFEGGGRAQRIQRRACFLDLAQGDSVGGLQGGIAGGTQAGPAQQPDHPVRFVEILDQCAEVAPSGGEGRIDDQSTRGDATRRAAGAGVLQHQAEGGQRLRVSRTEPQRPGEGESRLPLPSGQAQRFCQIVHGRSPVGGENHRSGEAPRGTAIASVAERETAQPNPGLFMKRVYGQDTAQQRFRDAGMTGAFEADRFREDLRARTGGKGRHGIAGGKQRHGGTQA
ncbi:hypothetical protein VY88_23820 [Azospirillum thiophilum]|uniref:Uncharacterized protein n=1 Tax=Azospirillum thiophilum TaxID=528244 RepID=A0AAC9EY08_9PROT|nr:hypothetical protein AL072_19415 [Azospirillum thiophilum]KJR63175.1 hypothetical protein VY88_23820 [Azospirillum thiophilum]